MCLSPIASHHAASLRLLLALVAQVEACSAERGFLDCLQQLCARGAVVARIKFGGFTQCEDCCRVGLHARTLRAGRCVFAAAVDGVDAPCTQRTDVARAFTDAGCRRGDVVEHDVDLLAFGAGRSAFRAWRKVMHGDGDALCAR